MLRTTTIRSAKNLSLNIIKDDKVGGNGDVGDDKTVEKSSSKKSSGLTEYFIFLSFKK